MNLGEKQKKQGVHSHFAVCCLMAKVFVVCWLTTMVFAVR